MRNLLKNLIVIIILILLFIKRPILIKEMALTIDIWNKVFFPSIFPILILSDYILSTNLINYIASFIGKVFVKLFKQNKYASFVFIMSMLTGSPTNAKYIYNLYQNNIINEEMASKILASSTLYNPLLILTITSYLEIKDQIFLIITNILINLIIAFLNRNYKAIDLNINFKLKEFNLTKSITNSVNTLLSILGCLCFFSIISTIFNLNHPLFKGILEITDGINYINIFNIDYKYKLIFTSILLSFGGLSILIQIKSIFKDAKIDYSLYYKSRIIHIFLFIILTYLWSYCY